MQKVKIKTITVSGMIAALIFLATYFFHVPMGLNAGYVHFGDAFVYAAASMLPLPFAMAASAVGAGLSDLLSGAAVWTVPTMIIKSLCCLPFTSVSARLLCKRNAIAVFLSGLITIMGYGIATAFISGGIAVAVAEAPFSLIQATGSAICYFILAAALDKSGIKTMINIKKIY